MSGTNLIAAALLGNVLPRLAHAFLGPVARPRHKGIVLRLSVDVSTHELTVHVLDCDDPEVVIAQIRQRYEGPLMEMLG